MRKDAFHEKLLNIIEILWQDKHEKIDESGF